MPAPDLGTETSSRPITRLSLCLLLRERLRSCFLRQAATDIQLQVTHIYYQSFLGLAAAHACSHQSGQNLLAQGLG